MKKKKIIITALIVNFSIVIVLAYFFLAPYFRGLNNEYTNSNTIKIIESYVKNNNGTWPSDASKINVPTESNIEIDYKLDINDENFSLDKLKAALKPRVSFKTYPHYDKDLERLYEIIISYKK